MTIGKCIAAFIGCLVFTYSLCQIYHSLSYFTHLPIWLSAAIIHSIASVAVLLWVQKQHKPSKIMYWHIWLPGTLVIFAQILLVALTYEGSHVALKDIPLKYFGWILWVPIVEELTFRVGVGDFLKRRYGNMWGAYFSILVFCGAHSVAQWNAPLDILFKVPMGVLLLAICCELIYHYTKSKIAIIYFHLACNLSALTFMLFDSRWLKWLVFLYH